MDRFYDTPCEPKRMNALNLAFVGDCVFDLFVRERLTCMLDAPVNTLHRRAVEQVCCGSQAKAAQRLLPNFTEEEKNIEIKGSYLNLISGKMMERLNLMKPYDVYVLKKNRH